MAKLRQTVQSAMEESSNAAAFEMQNRVFCPAESSSESRLAVINRYHFFCVFFTCSLYFPVSLLPCPGEILQTHQKLPTNRIRSAVSP